MGFSNSNSVDVKLIVTPKIESSIIQINRMSEFFSIKGEKLADLKGHGDSPSQQIEIIAILKDVEKAMYSIELISKLENLDISLGKTKEIQGVYIDFMTSFGLRYYFEKDQEILINVKKDHKYFNLHFQNR